MGSAIALLRETRFLTERTTKALEHLSSAKPAMLSDLVEPMQRLKEQLERDLPEIERLAAAVDARLGNMHWRK